MFLFYVFSYQLTIDENYLPLMEKQKWLIIMIKCHKRQNTKHNEISEFSDALM